MIFAELSYSPLKLIEKTAVGEPDFLRNPINAHNFAVSKRRDLLPPTANCKAHKTILLRKSEHQEQ